MSILQPIEPPDPIIEELRVTRRRLLKEHGGVSGLARFLRSEEAKSTWPKAELPEGRIANAPTAVVTNGVPG